MKNNFLILLLFISIQYVDGQIPNNEVKLDFSNPSFFAGSNLPNVYQRLLINGDYAKMLKFTASQSRHKFGDDKLMEYFQNIDFGYKLKIKSRNFEKDGTQTLNCEAVINSTKKIVRFKCVIENDTAKIVIVNLNKLEFP